MQVHRSLPDHEILDGCALTIGTFDGVHRGHQLLVTRLKAEAEARGLQTAALTFDDMPICLLRPDVCPPLLTLPDEKIEAFADTALDHLFIVPFTQDIARQGAREWMERWVENIGLRLFVGGPDFALGRDREGTISQLAVMGADLGFEALALDEKLLEQGVPISSTRSRGVIERGEVERATAFLGRPYRMSGRVVSGQQLGRTLGIPTINIEPHARKCVPSNGVYAIRARWQNQSLPAALNIGVRPTVDGTRRQIEFHVLDRDIPIPPESVEIEFASRLREERRFSGVDELVSQMRRDLESTRALFE